MAMRFDYKYADKASELHFQLSRPCSCTTGPTSLICLADDGSCAKEEARLLARQLVEQISPYLLGFLLKSICETRLANAIDIT